MHLLTGLQALLLNKNKKFLWSAEQLSAAQAQNRAICLWLSQPISNLDITCFLLSSDSSISSLLSFLLPYSVIYKVMRTLRQYSCLIWRQHYVSILFMTATLY
jgi:hypothetical protein